MTLHRWTWCPYNEQSHDAKQKQLSRYSALLLAGGALAQFGAPLTAAICPGPSTYKWAHASSEVLATLFPQALGHL